ncbi:MAG: hypothetical protein GJT30_00575 [Geobacter sp.]|nr:hypothetical protein [Geobacter sp.]
MYIQIRDNTGTERFIEEEHLDASIASGEVVAFRRSDGWISAPSEQLRGNGVVGTKTYRGQERRRSLLSKRRIPSDDTNS